MSRVAGQLEELNETEVEVAEDRDLVGMYLDEIARTRLLSAAEEVELAEAIEAGLYAEQLLGEVCLTVDDVDVYVPHQANVRIITHAAEKLGFPEEKVIVNVDRYGNTSSGSIPLALADAVRDGTLRKGHIVLMTGMGAGLTWGSGVMEWTEEMAA